MKIFVCVKQVPDTETKIKIKSDGSGIETQDVKWIMNPYDEFAVEEALKTRDKLADGSTVTALTLGPKARCTEVLRTALALGCDNAIVIDSTETLDTSATARALSEALKKEDAGLIFLGKQAIDDDCSQVPQLIAAHLELPHASVVVKFELSADKSKATVERESEGGTKEILELSLPCVIGANKGLNTPRFASLPNIMKAKKKEIAELNLAQLGISETDTKTRHYEFQLPPPRPAGRTLEGSAADLASQVVKLLREEAKVI
ncbi:MAG: electron transfer flavoprotein subunit beta/FixA family protein [Oligoflexia bacterium]|nr:electron transfer flavoprotein subunit beta/FixA family protein [Oligoflexia bacterium]